MWLQMACKKQTYSYQKGRWGRDKMGTGDKQTHTTVYKLDKHGPTVQFRKFYSISYNNI